MKIHQLKRRMPQPVRRLLANLWAVGIKTKLSYEARVVDINPKPIFVLGNQKSGTSATAILLAEITGLSVTNDLTKEYKTQDPSYRYVQKGTLSFSDFISINKLDFSRDIVKDPGLTMFYSALTEHFPESKFVFVLRDPRDNIRSILNRLHIPGDHVQLDRKFRREITPAWGLVIDGQWLGLTGANYIEMLAARWNVMADVYLRHQNQIVLLRYEKFLNDKVGEITRLAQQLGLRPIHDISQKVDKQFQPPGNRDVTWEAFFGRDNLSRIETICGDRMKLLEYQLCPMHTGLAWAE